MRPLNIIKFERVYLGAIVLNLIGNIVNWSRTQEILAQSQAQAGGAVPAGFGTGFGIGAAVGGLVVNLLLWYFIAKKGSNVARWIYTVLIAIGVLGLIAVIRNPMLSGLPALMAIVALVLNVVAVWLTFRPDANAWLKGERTADLDGTFR